jgi:hypothetical protein
MSPFGTKLPIRDVRATAAIEGKAEETSGSARRPRARSVLKAEVNSNPLRRLTQAAIDYVTSHPNRASCDSTYFATQLTSGFAQHACNVISPPVKRLPSLREKLMALVNSRNT